MLGPHITLLSLLISVIRGYLPSTDLTNSIASPYEHLIEKEDVIPEEITSAEVEPSASPYRNRLTFRRRNTNAGMSGLGFSSSPFSKMNYKTGYGSNRRSGFSRNLNYPSYTTGSNTYSSGSGGYGYSSGDSYPSGLLNGNNRNFGYFGSTSALRNKNFNKPSMYPNYYGNRASNDLMSSFSPSSFGGMPSHKFGSPSSYIPQVPTRELPTSYNYNHFSPNFPTYGGPQDYAGKILSNRWNDKAISGGEDSGVDGYAVKNSTKT